MTDYTFTPYPETTPPPEAPTPPRPIFDFESLTLWQALWLFLYRPRRVANEFLRVVTESEQAAHSKMRSTAYRGEILQDSTSSNELVSSDMPYTPTIDLANPLSAEAQAALQAEVARTDARYQADLTLPQLPKWAENMRFGRYLVLEKNSAAQAGLLLIALFFAIVGMGLLRSAALDPVKKLAGDTSGAFFWIFFSGLVVIAAAAVQTRGQQGKSKDAPLPKPPITEKTVAQTHSLDLIQFFNNHSMRIALVPVAALFAWFAYDKNTALTPTGEIEAIFTTGGVIAWFMAIVLWFLILAIDLNKFFAKLITRPNPATPQQAMPRRRSFIQLRWAYIGLIAVFLVAAYFRLHNLDGVPPEMTSDHIEKLRDAVRVDEGYYGIFFENNEGREGFQMYLIAIVGDWLGVGFSFRTLKYATILEGMLTVILAFWLGKEVVGRDTREREQLGDWVGLATAALIAISSWHTMLSRLGLRIALTPLTTLIVVIFMVRAIRYNRRLDFVLMGVTLGAGTYFYQANRMLPLLVVPMVLLAAIVHHKGSWKNSARYIINLAAAGTIALVIYLPMHRYSVESPAEFWKRTYGRMFGDRAFECINPDTGRPDYCPPSTAEVLEYIFEKRDILIDNYEKAFKMYSWEGDGMWILNSGGYPALDSITNALLAIGLIMWVILIFKRRDVALLAIPLGVIVMLLPSTLALTQTSENPSFTRTSGTIPFIFLMAAYPLGVMAYEAVKTGYSRPPFVASSACMVALVVGLASTSNYDTYFNVYREGYEMSWKPYSQIAAPLRNFAETRGSYGNAFYVHSDHWLDHRILGTVAGDFNWPNGLLRAEDVYRFILANDGTIHQYDPTKPLFFMVNTRNLAGLEWLQTHFPGGEVREIQVKFNNNYYVYEAPAGWEWLTIWVTEQSARWSCITNCLPGPK